MKGIYKIIQKSTGLVYIGQSKNIFARWSQHIQSIDNLSFHQAFQQNPADFTFEVVAQNDDWTVDDLNREEKRWIIDTHANDPKYGFNGTAGNGSYKLSSAKQMLLVKGSINRHIYSEYLKNVENKKILIIGNFKGCDIISLYNNVTVITDDYDFTCDDAKIIKVSSGEELMGEINKMEKDEFDLIIANPPYNIGNKIVSKFVDKAKESVVLMPISCYKHKELYKHILTLKLVDPKTFTDADITDNLSVCKLIDKEIDQTYEEIELQTFDPEYRKFYELNISKINNHNKFVLTNKPDIVNYLDPEYDFVVPQKVTNDGVHKTKDCMDYRFNFLHDKDAFRNKNGTLSSVWVNLNYHDKKIKEHLMEFWYKNPLMDKLLFGLNSQYGHINKALPNIDWSVDRDYEHLTYDELLNIMKSERGNK